MVDSTLVKKTAEVVAMTSRVLLDALVPLIGNLSREMPKIERYRRLLDTLPALFPGDAAALLRLEGETLVPVAIDGLSGDTLGRRFRVAEHPRFARILARAEPTRFAANSDLPDPYDGLVKGVSGNLEVHDCLGCPLVIHSCPWGLLTLDALDPARFDDIDMAAGFFESDGGDRERGRAHRDARADERG